MSNGAFKPIETGLEDRRNINVEYCAKQLEWNIVVARINQPVYVNLTETEALYVLEILRRHMRTHGVMEDGAPSVDAVPVWVSVKDRLPPNADCPGAFCPRYLVQTKYGITEGWYNPDKGYWYCLIWFMRETSFYEDNIDFEHGDIPMVLGNCPVTHWMPLPEPPKMEESSDAQEDD